jgi:enterochelin esterase family protein
VAFLYRGPAESVSFPGDFNGWDPEAPGAMRVGLSDVWIQEDFFPADARLDYKVVADGVWGLDPFNPLIQRSGFGDNSELRMPGYVPSPWVDRRDGVPAGALTTDSLESERLGFTVALQIYTPPGYADLGDLPVMYVTDGHEYADDRLGAMVPVMDNLIAAGELRPMMAVFIDMRVGGSNRRHDLLILNPAFVDFVVEELVPTIDASFRTSSDRMDRGMLGTSLGGLNSAWFGYAAPETFGRIAIQSPAFQAGEGRIFGLWEESPPSDIDIFLSHGSFNDFGETTARFLSMLDRQGYDHGLAVVNEGHSWGNWRALLDDVLLRFWPAE